MRTAANITLKQSTTLIFLGAVALFLFGLSYFPYTVETWYSTLWYPKLGQIMRQITAKIPFSLGDIGYLLLAIYLIVNVIRFIIQGAGARFPLDWWTWGGYKIIRFALKLYIGFKLLWGLNYNREGIAYQLYLHPKPYTVEEVTSLTNDLIDSLNATRKLIPDTLLPQPSIETIKAEAVENYGRVSKDYQFLSYKYPSVKGSLYSEVGDYVGFTGYFNPFSGEAQLRTDIPRVLIPYVCSHEMAHQLGYASESEANFVGYLAASTSPQAYTRYSMYLELFSYAQGEEIFQYGRKKDYQAFDSIIKQNRQRLDTLVKKERKEIREFFRKRRKSVAPAFNNLYDQYLKLNAQEKGIESYDQVIGWLIAYKKKYGKI
ncbi:MAG: hypothetical protein CFE25_13905 [Chitinophagaceae bacterium BSSC1]|nr:MAG: hypothetical protein CFE25_13905 [Chitinophagaceae bacterium BSSC1]